jgi:hypothetical protein
MQTLTRAVLASALLAVSAWFACAPAAAQAPDAPDLYLPLKLEEGTWDADVTFYDGEKESGKAQGVQVNTLLANGHWITNDFRIPASATLPAFQGHGVWGFDPVAKTYVNTWVDTNDRTVRTDYGFWYAKENTMAWSSKQSDGQGHFVDYRMTEEFKGNVRIFTVHQLAMVRPKPYLLLRIVFTKRTVPN